MWENFEKLRQAEKFFWDFQENLLVCWRNQMRRRWVKERAVNVAMRTEKNCDVDGALVEGMNIQASL
jgi:hypothetical protein